MGYTVSPTLRRSGQAAKEAMDKVYDRVAEEVIKKSGMGYAVSGMKGKDESGKAITRQG